MTSAASGCTYAWPTVWHAQAALTTLTAGTAASAGGLWLQHDTAATLLREGVNVKSTIAA